jgi:hypothetical protein
MNYLLECYLHISFLVGSNGQLRTLSIAGGGRLQQIFLYRLLNGKTGVCFKEWKFAAG